MPRNLENSPSDCSPLRERLDSAGPSAAGKPVSASRSEMVEAVLPNDANPLGNMLGGRVMHLIDIAGALAAHRHSNSHVVTASVDYLDFRFPIRVGEFIVLKSSVNRVFHTSMEVGVKVFSGKYSYWRAEAHQQRVCHFRGHRSERRAAQCSAFNFGNRRRSSAISRCRRTTPRAARLCATSARSPKNDRTHICCATSPGNR